MSEFRKDALSGQWVIVAPERASRPTDFPVERRRKGSGFCPFCEGHEEKTPHELFALRGNGSAADSPGWRVRVVPNRFPALNPQTPLEERSDSFAKSMSGFGFHEVIIDAPQHAQSLSELEPAGVRDLLGVYRERLSALRKDGRVSYAMLFKNVGAAAGATIEHSHTQLIGMPVTPPVVRGELTHCAEFARLNNGACLLCNLVEQELEARTRVISEGPHFVALAPFASRFPFETWIMPKRHFAHFEEQPPSTYADLAEMLCALLKRLDAALDQPAYNILLHTSPFGEESSASYHWHLEIIPSVTRVAGFEWGTGFYINPVAPESAAALMGMSSPSRPAAVERSV